MSKYVLLTIGIILILVCMIPLCCFIYLKFTSKLLKNKSGLNAKLELMKWKLDFNIDNTNYLQIIIWLVLLIFGVLAIYLGYLK